MKKFITLLLATVLLVFGCAACGGDNSDSKPSATPAESEKAAQATETTEDLYANKINFSIEMENGGIMKGELYPDVAPATVENFVKLANEKFYDGLIFHRVIPGFMIQGGGFDTDYVQKKTASIKGEFTANGFKNDLKHTRGVISMARTSVPDSATSQFFIMHEDAPSLDGQYAAFGKITEGLDVVDEIAETETGSKPELGMDDFPVEQQVIKTITIQK